MEAVQDCYHLRSISMIQDLTPAEQVMLMDFYKEYFLDPLKENISITELYFLSDFERDKFRRQLDDIEHELEVNRGISYSYSPHDIIHRTEISIRHLKVCRRRNKIVAFEYEITEDDWDLLCYHL